MLVVVETGETRGTAEVRLHDPYATVSDLRIALAVAAGGTDGDDDDDDGSVRSQSVAIDGRICDDTDVLLETGFGAGSVVSLGARFDGCSSGEDVGLVFEQIAGIDCGATLEIALGPTVVGRSADTDVRLDDPAVSARHCRIDRSDDGTVRIVDLDSRNGIRARGRLVESARLDLGDEVWIGAALWRLTSVSGQQASAAPKTSVGLSGTMAHNRPPRPSSSVEAVRLRGPESSGLGPQSVAFSWVAVVAPVLLAAVLVVMLGNVMFALFALLGPVTALGSWAEARSRNRRQQRDEDSSRGLVIATLRADAIGARDAERRRRRAESPDLAAIVTDCGNRASRLWERRLDHIDIGRLPIGVADLGWTADLDARGIEVSPEVAAAVAGTLTDTPLVIPFEEVGVIGIVGRSRSGRALARGIVTEVLAWYGPADLDLAIADGSVGSDGGPWDWVSWAPHDGSSPVRGADVAEWSARLPRPVSGRRRLVVIDGDDLLVGRASVARRLLGSVALPSESGIWGVVIVEEAVSLPASCRVVIHMLDDAGRASVDWLDQPGRVDQILVAGLSADRSLGATRCLARLEDSDVDEGGGLPDDISLLGLLGGDIDATAVVNNWASLGADPSPITPIGVSGTEVVEIDLRSEGPHALIGGTTGSGKSEFLRSFVVGLATRQSPEYLNFVLIDYKGGSAFDRCADLPHTVGMVTDLDGQLAERALQCLHAEIEYRERTLRTAGATDLEELRRAAGGPGLPRLIVVIDEFATLATELPDFMKSLVGIAQRGRSLGVHLVLATQRPSGVVNDEIRANTNLRIALRVQDAADSMDIIGTDQAAGLPRHLPGRACLRFGPGEVDVVQTARCTGPMRALGRAPVEAHFTANRLSGSTLSGSSAVDGYPSSSQSELDHIVDVVCEAFAQSGQDDPRLPWPDPLPDLVSLAVLADMPGQRSDTVSFALADHPNRQTQEQWGWRPASGNLVLIGALGSGVTSAMCAIAAACAQDLDRNVEMFGLDFGTGDLGLIEGLPQVGRVVGGTDFAGQRRLLHRFGAELERRRARQSGEADGTPAEWWLLIDNVGVLIADRNDPTNQDFVEDLQRLFLDGPMFGLRIVLGADRGGAIPTVWQSSISQTLLFDLADPMGHAMFGLRPNQIPLFVAGRAVSLDGQVVQVCWVDGSQIDDVASACRAAGAEDVPRPPTVDGPFGLEAIGTPEFGHRPWRLPLGLFAEDLSPMIFEAQQGDHLLVAGPPRSGRSNLLQCVAAQAIHAGVAVVAVAWQHSSLRELGLTIEPGLSAALEAVRTEQSRQQGAPIVVLVDDAELVIDEDGAGARLLDADGVLCVVAGETDALRSQFSHWTDRIAAGRSGVVLQPQSDLDGDVVRSRLGRVARMIAVTGNTKGSGVVVRQGVPAPLLTPLWDANTGDC